MHKINNTTAANCDTQLPKRRIVTWSQEEDHILRHQIRLHGTDNWAVITSKFKDKTTRQCRRRWYTYLNSDVKKGGWSPEEDVLLCEAHKIFGNRWTEIAKVVSGRTDNAVKNRFSTLCKKRARREALAVENNQNVPNEDGSSETRVPHKKLRRNHISDTTDYLNSREMPQGDCRKTNLQLRPPFAVLVQNFDIPRGLPTQNHATNAKEVTKDEAAISDMIQGMYLKKNDPEIIALMEQAELLSSLALIKVNTENTDQSLENAWKILQDFLNQSKEVDMITLRITDMDFQLENSKDLVEDLKGSKEGSQPSWRQSDLYAESPDNSEYSTGSTVLTHVAGYKPECNEVDVYAIHQETEAELHPTHIGHSNDSIPSCDDLGTDDRAVCPFASTEFNSPFQVTPLFRSLASGIPSPQFSESERHFLLKTLGVESASPDPSTKALQTPPCKRALIHSL